MIDLMKMSNVTQDMDKIIFIIRMFFISMCTYFTVLKVTNKQMVSKANILKITILTVFIAIICGEIKYTLDYLSSIICLILLLGIVYSIINKEEFIHEVVNIIICVGINYVVLFISVLISFIPNIIFLDAQNDWVNLFIMTLIHLILLCRLFKIQRFKNGFQFLKTSKRYGYFDILLLNLSITIIFLFIVGKNSTTINVINSIYLLVLISIIIFMTIKKTITMYYKHKMLIKDLDETKEELEKTKKDKERVEQENIEISKRAHTISHKIKSLNRKIDKLMMNNEIANELTIKDEIKQISREYYKNKVMAELDKTGVEIVDDMLDCMKEECVENSIDFELQINGNIHHMVNNYIPKEELQILLADHIKDAIIAIHHSDNINRSILVRLGLIDGIYSLYIYDSGIEFEIDTLINLGTKPITTHKEEGGTGMGFLNTFDTLKKHNATMIIDEIGKESKDNYTKVIMIKFDNKSEFEIKSYRDVDIKKRREEKS